MKAAILFSGGIESTVLLMQAIHTEAITSITVLFFDYGQKAARAEAEAIESILREVNQFNFKYIKIDSTIFGNNPLTDRNTEVDKYENYEEWQESFQPEEISPTTVPFRNGVFLAMGAAWCEANSHNLLYFGATGEWDYTGGFWGIFYPDCTPEFVGAMGASIQLGCKNVRLVAPFIWMNEKAVIVEDLYNYSAKLLKLTYSCYEGYEKHCGRCSGCLSRMEAFDKANVDDETEYEA